MIENGYTPDADEVLGAMGRIAREVIEIINGNNDHKRVFYQAINTNNATAEGAVDFAEGYFFGPVNIANDDLSTIDEFDDTTVDPNLWVTSSHVGGQGNVSITEDGECQILHAHNYNGSGAYQRSEIKTDLISNSWTLIRIHIKKIYHKRGADYGSVSAYVYLTDSDHTLALFSKSYEKGEGTDNTGYTIDLLIADDVIFFKVNDEDWSYADISSWDLNNLKFYFEACAGSPEAGYYASTLDMYFDWVRYYSFNNPPTASISTNLTELPQNTTNIVAYCNNRGSVPTMYLTPDNSAFIAADKNGLVRFDSATPTIGAKFQYSAYTKPFALKGWGAFVNFY